MATTIFENIKKLAVEKGISITNLEKEAGLGNGTIGKWQISIPKTDKLAAVAGILGVTVDELISEKEQEV